MADAAGRSAGLFDSLKALARVMLALVQTRVELAANEFEEQRVLIARELVLALSAVFLLGVGLVFVATFIVVWLWDSFRLLTLGGFALVFLLAALVAYARLRLLLAERPKAFSATLQELSKDLEAMR